MIHVRYDMAWGLKKPAWCISSTIPNCPGLDISTWHDMSDLPSTGRPLPLRKREFQRLPDRLRTASRNLPKIEEIEAFHKCTRYIRDIWMYMCIYTRIWWITVQLFPSHVLDFNWTEVVTLSFRSQQTQHRKQSLIVWHCFCGWNSLNSWMWCENDPYEINHRYVIQNVVLLDIRYYQMIVDP